MNALVVTGADMSGSELQTPVLGSPGESLQILQFPSQPGFVESTLLRIRGVLSVPKSSYGSSAAGIVAFGIGIVSDKAATAEAVPNPATATGYDWDGWMFLRQNITQVLDPAGEIVDVKSMRKWQSGDSIVFVAGASTDAAAGFASQAVSFSLRGLFLLP